jgi:EPS-associated MarR family transcriptional regulator
MAKVLGLSFGAINYCLKGLVEKGLVKIHNFKLNQNKFGYVYLLTPSGISEKGVLTRSFLKRKLQEYEEMKIEIKALREIIETENSQNLS